LYKEGQRHPRMMSIGLHCRLVGRAGRFAALERFVDYVLSHKDVWVCKRIEIAQHWRKVHPYKEFA
jgi:peptidoglycan/xylan/chitin deacetylase (PgdA/CDA1 family)